MMINLKEFKYRKLMKLKIGIIGLGYVGLPLAIEMSKKYDLVGYDKSSKRIKI